MEVHLDESYRREEYFQQWIYINLVQEEMISFIVVIKDAAYTIRKLLYRVIQTK